jgi:hypothetical protein
MLDVRSSNSDPLKIAALKPDNRQPTTESRKPPPEAGLQYDTARHPILTWGYNDLNRDSKPDTLITTWNGRTMAFVSDNGALPWPTEHESRDWDDYFNEAFSVGEEPPVTWNPMRSGWGGYTILVDRDQSGRFDDPGDWYYKVLDLNHDGDPDGEFYHAYPGQNLCSKLHINLNGEREMSYLDWEKFGYGYENRSLDGGKYVMNVHGNGFFLNAYTHEVQTGIENPLAWYDFNGDGFNNMSMRNSSANRDESRTRHFSRFEQIEISFELNGNTGPERWHSLDMQMTFVGDQRFRAEKTPGADRPLEYAHYIDRIPGMTGLKAAEFLSENKRRTRLEEIRRFMPYLDGYRIATDYDGWLSVWLQFDEDGDDTRWEEMFSRYEPEVFVLSDRIGDRYERDSRFLGRGKLYVGKFDRRIHLFHADFAAWDIDALAWYKGEEAYFAMVSNRPDDGPQPPVGLRYPRVRYTDTDGNGFIDRVEYLTVEYTGEFGTEEPTERVERSVLLLDYADDDLPHPDVCDLVDPRVTTPMTGWSIAKWDGEPLQPADFEGTPVKAGFDKMSALYDEACNLMWSDAQQLHQVAVKVGLNRSQELDRESTPRPSRAELNELRQLNIPQGYSLHLTGNTRREKYHNGYWLREKVFADIVAHSALDRNTLEQLYYTGKIEELCEYVLAGMKERGNGE